MIDTMWMVVTGEYSDYEVVCVCEDEGTAETIAEHANRLDGRTTDSRGRYCVEEIPVGTAATRKVAVYTVSVTERRILSWTAWPWHAVVSASDVDRLGGKWPIYRTVSRERALKVAHDLGFHDAAVDAGIADP